MSGATDVAQLLWSENETHATESYVVLDAARDPRVYGLICLTPGAICLYGDVGEELRRTSPHLVRLIKDSDYTMWLLNEIRGKTWGVFVVVQPGTGEDRMRRYCKRLLKVMGPSGELLLFRWYDPRVLSRFLPLCQREQEEELFGPTRRFVIEDESGVCQQFERKFSAYPESAV